MSYILEEQLAAAENYGRARMAKEIQYLVLHYTGNDGDSAASNANYFQNHVVKASAHYFVDDRTVYRSVPDLRVAWAVGGKKYASADQTGGGTLYGAVTNSNSISVELCDTRRDGIYQAAEETLENAVVLCAELMERYHIPSERVCRHFDVTGKLCPSYFVDETAWAAFRKRLQWQLERDGKMNGEETMTQEQFDTMMNNWLSRQGAREPSAASAEAREWAEREGLIGGFSDGSKQYKGFCTREQAIILLYRLWKAVTV